MKINIHQKTATNPQLEFWHSPAKYRAFIGGIGSGKTYAGAVEALRQPAGSVGMILAPTYPMLRDATFKTVVNICDDANIIKDLNKSSMHLTLINGSEILFRSSDSPDRLRGANLGWFWLDEAGMMKHDVWYIMLGRIRLSPLKAWVTTTPRGLNWLYDVFVKNKTDKHTLIKSKTIQNTYLPTDFIESVKGQYTTEFARQELEGEFIEDSSNLIKRDWWKYYRELPKVKRYIWSWDTAFETKTSSDYSVGQLWAECENGYYLVDLYRNKLEFPDLKKTVINLFRTNPSSVILVEQKASGHSLLQELRRGSSLPLKPIKVDSDKITRVNACLPSIEAGNVYLPENADWLLDFVEECSMFPSGRMHDDQVDAMSQALNYMREATSYSLGFL